MIGKLRGVLGKLREGFRQIKGGCSRGIYFMFLGKLHFLGKLRIFRQVKGVLAGVYILHFRF